MGGCCPSPEIRYPGTESERKYSMVKIEDIRDIHLEPTTLCNARCPLCQRNANGYPHNFGYPETILTLEQVQKIFPPEFVPQLTSLTVCGNYGDFVVNPDSIEIIKYFQQHSPKISVCVSTNGSARNDDFWRELGTMNIEMLFCLDGLEDTHHLYRLDTDWNRIIHNAQTYIAAGGHATWKMIKFKHNEHQVDDCRRMAHKLKFRKFELTDHSRSIGPVLGRDGKFAYMIGADAPEHPPTARHVIHWMVYPNVKNSLGENKEKDSVDCYSNKASSIYVAANGEIYPCCFLGFYPRTFSNGTWSHLSNLQIHELLVDRNNNALEVGLQSALEWFDGIEQRWAVEKYDQGRLRLCDEHCGKNKYISLEKVQFSQNSVTS